MGTKKQNNSFDWFADLTQYGQAQYLSKHPKSAKNMTNNKLSYSKKLEEVVLQKPKDVQKIADMFLSGEADQVSIVGQTFKNIGFLSTFFGFENKYLDITKIKELLSNKFAGAVVTVDTKDLTNVKFVINKHDDRPMKMGTIIQNLIKIDLDWQVGEGLFIQLADAVKEFRGSKKIEDKDIDVLLFAIEEKLNRTYSAVNHEKKLNHFIVAKCKQIIEKHI